MSPWHDRRRLIGERPRRADSRSPSSSTHVQPGRPDEGARDGFAKRLSRSFRLLCGLTLVLPIEGRAGQGTDPRPAPLVEWDSGESAERLFRASHKMDFFPLSNHFISQDNSIFCGPVSSAIVLNALRLGKREGLPRDRRSIAEDEMAWLPKGADPFYGKYTPNNVLSDRTKTRLEVLGKPHPYRWRSEERFRSAAPPARAGAAKPRSRGRDQGRG